MTIAALLSLLATLSAAQNPPLRFEVASIKQHVFTGSGGVGMRVSGSLVTFSTVTVRRLIQQAYDVKDYQIEGGPDWMSSSSPAYDISARAPGEAPPTQNDIRGMLRTLLAERFKLSLHRENKEIAAYNLVIGKNGPKLKAGTGGPPSARLSMGPSRRMQLTNTNIGGFLGGLTTQLDRPAVDHTGLTGVYDIELEWNGSPLQTAAPDPNAATPGAADVFTAIQEQLGLKLEPTKVMAEVLVIDHAEKPEPN